MASLGNKNVGPSHHSFQQLDNFQLHNTASLYKFTTLHTELLYLNWCHSLMWEISYHVWHNKPAIVDEDMAHTASCVSAAEGCTKHSHHSSTTCMSFIHANDVQLYYI